MRILRALAAILVLAIATHAKELKITLLATTDLHGNLLPYDYYTAQPADRGLAKVATLIRAARAENPNTLLIDCGDTIQGSPLESIYQTYVQTAHLPLNLRFAAAPLDRDPMMLAMNELKYDAMVVGNHEFNFGLVNLNKARAQALFPWISANIKVERRGTQRAFAPYFVKLIAGQVKVAVIGVTTPMVPEWETPEHYNGYRFEPGVEAVRAALAELRDRVRPDIVIVAAHSGLDRDPQTGVVRPDDSRENFAYQIATEVKGIDAIVFGHTHQQLAEYKIGDVLLMQPKNWGISLGRMDFVVEPARGGTWKIASKTNRIVPVTADTRADAKVLDIARPYHDLAERYLNTRIADAAVDLDSRLARVEDTAVLDAIQHVQLAYAKADVSFASSVNPRLVIPKGQVTVRQIAALYIYDNQLYAVEGTGKMVHDVLENAARYFQTCSGDCSRGPLINPQVFGFNYDIAEGVNYEIDLTRPAGERIRNLRWHGQPLADDQPLRIAVNNYRAAGGAGYSMFRGAKIVWKSSEEIRDLAVQYYIEHKQLPTQPDANWRIVPDAARKTLREEALAEARKANMQ
ncbi:MAG TPA: 5'-nucleotidase C-terminal domain-containing protein [Bryobacteraceae bacterium]|nr:5'-nucleotidase C-terminal domain-containing protein [Bryobacteraceae bacterium]